MNKTCNHQYELTNFKLREAQIYVCFLCGKVKTTN